MSVQPTAYYITAQKPTSSKDTQSRTTMQRPVYIEKQNMMKQLCKNKVHLNKLFCLVVFESPQLSR